MTPHSTQKDRLTAILPNHTSPPNNNEAEYILPQPPPKGDITAKMVIINENIPNKKKAQTPSAPLYL